MEGEKSAQSISILSLRDRLNIVFKNRPVRNEYATTIKWSPVRDGVPIAHKFICGKQMPAPKIYPSRMGQDANDLQETVEIIKEQMISIPNVSFIIFDIMFF